MIPLPDSKPHNDFFCSGCQAHKAGRLFSHRKNNRRYCTTCALPFDERAALNIPGPYKNIEKFQEKLTGDK